MSSLDKYQLVTLSFGAIIVVTVFLEYNNKVDPLTNIKTRNFIRLVEQSLGFLFAAYALLVSTMEEKTGKNVVLAISAISLIVYAFKPLPVTGTSGWTKVNEEITPYLAQGAFFALPLAIWGFRA